MEPHTDTIMGEDDARKNEGMPQVLFDAVRAAIALNIPRTVVIIGGKGEFGVLGQGENLAAVMLPNDANMAMSVLATLAVIIDDMFGQAKDGQCYAPQLLRMVAENMEKAYAEGAIPLLHETPPPTEALN